jgi:hypothetical protein
MTTFADLDIPFPLFEAAVEEASEYAGAGQCFACGNEQPHCFELGIGAAVILPCPRCGTTNGLDADDRADGRCRSCGAIVRFPHVQVAAPGVKLLVCHACLRAGHAALTKDTTLGMVSWEEALDVADVQSILSVGGWLGGSEGSEPGTAESQSLRVAAPEPSAATPPRKGKRPAHARPSPEAMLELLRTPGYVSIQGERWELCCERPMIYLGPWTQDEFNAATPDGDGQALFDEIVQEPEDGLWENDLHDSAGIYVFRCAACGRRTANWDVS